MINISFSKEEIRNVFKEKVNNNHPRVREKMEAVYLYAMGVSMDEICRLCKISKKTLNRDLWTYLNYGIEGLKIFCPQKPRSRLLEHRAVLEEEFRKNPPATVGQAAERIKELTGIELHETQVRKFLRRIGMKPLVVGSIPAKADPVAQEEFLKNKLEPVLEEARQGKRQVFFVDASHFVWAFFSGTLWCFERVFVPTPAGRNRFNVLGALNAITHEIITVTNDKYIDGKSVIELFHNIRAKYPEGLITLILDNAPYQKSQAVRDVAESLGIDLLYLPTYSPNLNLIERLWKGTKKECLNSKYHGTFGDFKAVIMNYINNPDEKLASLLTLNFQMYSDNPCRKQTSKKSKEKAA